MTPARAAAKETNVSVVKKVLVLNFYIETVSFVKCTAHAIVSKMVYFVFDQTMSRQEPIGLLVEEN